MQSEVLSREDWQWLADQLRAWPLKRVHPDRTMCEATLRPMAADVIEAALVQLAEADEEIERLRVLANTSVSQEAFDAAAEWYENGGAEQMTAGSATRPYAEFRAEVMRKIAPDASDPEPSRGRSRAFSPLIRSVRAVWRKRRWTGSRPW